MVCSPQPFSLLHEGSLVLVSRRLDIESRLERSFSPRKYTRHKNTYLNASDVANRVAFTKLEKLTVQNENADDCAVFLGSLQVWNKQHVSITQKYTCSEEAFI